MNIAAKTALKCSIAIQLFSTVSHKLRGIISNRSCMSCADLVMWPCIFLTVQQTSKEWLSHDMIFQVGPYRFSSRIVYARDQSTLDPITVRYDVLLEFQKPDVLDEVYATVGSVEKPVGLPAAWYCPDCCQIPY